MSCGLGCTHGSNPALLWLWHRPVATVPIGPLAWESPHAEGAAQDIAKRQKKNYVFTLVKPMHAEVPRPKTEPMPQQ